MSRKIISTFTAAAMSMSIALAVPVAVTAVSSVTVVSEAQASWGSKLKKAANQSSAQTAMFRVLDRKLGISLVKSCPNNKFLGQAVRDNKLNATRSAISSWENTVRKSLPRRYADWSQAKNKRMICSRNDRSDQNYRCAAIAVPCSQSVVGISR
jgi:hypothetical protein